jgi:hypothetical protein
VRVAWGLLPVGVPLLAVLTLGLGALALPRAGGFDRVLAGGLLTLTLIVVVVRLLGAVGLLTTPALLGLLIVATLAVVVGAWVRRVGWGLPWRQAASVETLPLLLVAIVAVGIAIVAAYYLPVWQFDALGYHLPYVNFALQRGTFADIPTDAPYLSSYPHVVEYAITAWRALLPDDRLVELAHLPFGLLGAHAIATIARRQGARADHAVAAGAGWLTLPAVFLQLPTNYTDVASAALLLAAIAMVSGPVDRTRIVLAGVVLGLFLGSKPTAPVATLVLLLVLTVRACRAQHRGAAIIAWLVTLALGAESYAVNVARYDNPIWPVRVDIGPVHLPGTQSMSALLRSGAAAPHTHGNLAARIAESWSTIFPPVPAFDMRVGGLGLLFLCALPFAIWRAVRSRSLTVALCVVASLATPDPAVARYVLGFAGLVLAFAVPAVEHPRLGRGARSVVFGVAALAAAQGLVVAYPGLTGEGPHLRAYVHMTQAERQRAVGADGPPTRFLDAIAQLRPGEITVFDRSADLPYLAWPFDLSRDAARIPDDVDAKAAERIIDAPNVRMLIVGDDTVTGSLVRRDPQRFVPQFHCKSSTCTVYLRR